MDMSFNQGLNLGVCITITLFIILVIFYNRKKELIQKERLDKEFNKFDNLIKEAIEKKTETKEVVQEETSENDEKPIHRTYEKQVVDISAFRERLENHIGLFKEENDKFYNIRISLMRVKKKYIEQNDKGASFLESLEDVGLRLKKEITDNNVKDFINQVTTDDPTPPLPRYRMLTELEWDTLANLNIDNVFEKREIYEAETLFLIKHLIRGKGRDFIIDEEVYKYLHKDFCITKNSPTYTEDVGLIISAANREDIYVEFLK